MPLLFDNRGFTLFELLFTSMLLAGLSLAVIMPVRALLLPARSSLAIQRLLVDLETARLKARLSAQPVRLDFTSFSYRETQANLCKEYGIPFSLARPGSLQFDRNGMPLAPATLSFSDSRKIYTLIISKQGRIRCE